MSQNFKDALQAQLKENGMNVSKEQVTEILNAFQDVIANFMLKDETISIKGFLKIWLNTMEPAQRRNPKTAEIISVGKKFYPKVSFSESFKKNINEKYQTKQ